MVQHQKPQKSSTPEDFSADSGWIPWHLVLEIEALRTEDAVREMGWRMRTFRGLGVLFRRIQALCFQVPREGGVGRNSSSLGQKDEPNQKVTPTSKITKYGQLSRCLPTMSKLPTAFIPHSVSGLLHVAALAVSSVALPSWFFSEQSRTCLPDLNEDVKPVSQPWTLLVVASVVPFDADSC